jgi:predicted GNAT family acetyltransferase
VAPELVGAGAEFLLDFAYYHYHADIFWQERNLKMQIKYYRTAKEFLSHAGGALSQDEAHYGLIFSLAKRLVENPHWYGKLDPWFCCVHEKGVICAVAMRTPPYKVLLAYFSGDLGVVAENLVASISKKEAVIPGVAGDKEITDMFKELWYRKHDVKIKTEVTVNQRIYKLEKVNDVPLSPGRLRQATEVDTLLVKKWAHAFYNDTSGSRRNMPETDITPQIGRGAVFFWEDKIPVSMAMKYRPTDNGMTVSTVYTPPELRGKGYATSCVAELSRNILHSGYRFCTLYTNLANPTSNSIYMKIGFKPVCDSVDYTFEMP